MADTIDVVIPMRNGAATIAAALASVVGQTRPPNRLIVVDDGSTDGGAAVVRGVPAAEVITTSPMGVSHARNTGIRASRAEFIAFLDCDDWWLPGKLAAQHAAFARRPAAVAVNAAFMTVDLAGRRIPDATPPAAVRGADAHTQLLTLFNRACGGSSTMMARRVALEEAGGFDGRLAYGEDRDMWLRLAQGREFEYCPEILACIVNNPQSVTRRAAGDARLRREMLMQNLEVMEKWVGVTPTPSRFYMNCRFEILFQAVRSRQGHRELRAFRQELIRRAPRLAARIAPSDAEFVAGLLLSGVVNARTGLGRLVRHARRRPRPGANDPSSRPSPAASDSVHG